MKHENYTLGGVKMPYSSPETEVIAVKVDNNFLDSSFVTSGSSTTDIDDLGDTTMGSIIWN